MLRRNLQRKALCAGQQLLAIQRRGKCLDKAVCPTTQPPDCPPCCEIKRPKPKPCNIPKQRKWTGCDKICLPCCEKICVPQSCIGYTIGLAVCRKEEYRLPAFSECSKLYRRKRYVKECCYGPKYCHVIPFEQLNIHELIPIRERQRRAMLTRLL